MRMTLILIALLGAGLALVAWLLARGPSDTEAQQIAAVLEDPAPPEEPHAYAHCASCHLHDGSGRADGSIPKLNGQRRAVLENKLFRMRAGMMRLPVMDPYARTLAPAEISELAKYLSGLPDTENEDLEEADGEGASLFATHCASCHGAQAEGHDGLFASRLCGQYAGYLSRRLDEIRARRRGDADAVMQGVVDSVPAAELQNIVRWLAAGKGCASP